MNKHFLTLAGRIEGELDEIEEIIARIERGWERYNVDNEELYLDSVALNLHDYYSALEKIFKLIAKEIDDSIPEGASWHQELLKQMSIKIKNVRPQVISRDTIELIDEYRGFRHIVRNVYSYKFSSEKVARLIDKLDEANLKLMNEIRGFLEFLEEAGRN